MNNEEAAKLRAEIDHFLEGQTHLFCALANALERSGTLERSQLRQAIREKVAWLEHHNVEIGVATPLLMAEQWLIDPPPNPRDPHEGRPGDHLRPVPRR